MLPETLVVRGINKGLWRLCRRPRLMRCMAVMCGYESWGLLPDKAIRKYIMMTVDGQTMTTVLKYLMLSFVVQHVGSFENWGTRNTLFHPDQRLIGADGHITCRRMGIVRCRHFIMGGTRAMRVTFNRGG